MAKRWLCLLFAVVGCGGSDNGITNPPPKPDPWLTVRVHNQLDTTTAPGRAHWHIYALLTGPYTAQNGIARQGNISLQDIRLGHSQICIAVAADSVGQRLISVVAFADTTSSQLTPDTPADSIVAAWYSGNHSMPSGWMALSNTPTDAWQSAQYLAGHGQNAKDPIKWGLDWTGSGTATFYERDVTDTSGCNTAG